jgi:hypothetical protein
MENTWVYLNSEPQLWTVGFYDSNGEWHPESDHASEQEAALRVNFLNGGNADSLTRELSELREERDKLKLIISGKTFFDEKEVMQKEIDGLREENERLKAMVVGLAPKSVMSESVDPDGYATAAAKILHALHLVIGEDVNEFAMPVIIQIIKNNVLIQNTPKP